MTQLDELLAELEAWSTRLGIGSDAEVLNAYAKYKAAPEPLVLEAVECTESVILFDYWEEDESVQYNGQCYKLPED